MKKILLFLCCSLLLHVAGAQVTRYVVKFKNKGGTPHNFANPSTYLSQRAIDRRTKYNIAVDSTDLPVTPAYITQVKNVPNVTVLNISKWLNAVTIQTSDAAAITTINGFSFVSNVSGIAAKENTNLQSKFDEPATGLQQNSFSRVTGTTSDFYNYGTGSLNEIHVHNGELLHNIGLRGQGMQIAMLDNGFNNYTALKAFDSVNANNQVLGTWDFVAREQNVANDGSHGMSCFSTIAANIPGQFIGKAPKASFWLYQTEDNSGESPIEEFNWVCGAERADSSGTDVLSSSLGYNTFDNPAFNHTYAQLDGNTTMGAIGADLAAKKGILVFISAGNDGSNSWHYIATPADADSVIAVGAVNTSGIVGSFSSYGPSSDGQIKPAVASNGVAAMVQATNNTIITGNGTSYACPNMAGLGTILWQAFPEYNNMKIADALQKAGNKYTTPDDRVGYGIPDLRMALTNLLAEFSTASSSAVTNCNTTISWSSKDVQTMKYEIERKAPGESAYTKMGEKAAQSGIVLANRTYQFDASLTGLQPGTAAYRIRQILDTSSASFYATYIDSVQVTVPVGCITTAVSSVNASGLSVTVIPNPFTSSTINLTTESSLSTRSITFVLFDAMGAKVAIHKITKLPGIQNVSLTAGNLSAGKYFIKALDDNGKVLAAAEAIKL